MHAERQEAEALPDLSPIDAALAWHAGDARATIATLIEDCRHLRQQLALTEGGMTRGWSPSFDRSE